MSTIFADDISSQCSVRQAADHLVAVGRDEPLQRLAREHERKVVFRGGARQLRGRRDRDDAQVRPEARMDAGLVSLGDRARRRSPGESKQHPQPAGARDFSRDAVEDFQLVTDDELGTPPSQTVVVSKARFRQSALALLLSRVRLCWRQNELLLLLQATRNANLNNIVNNYGTAVFH